MLMQPMRTVPMRTSLPHLQLPHLRHLLMQPPMIRTLLLQRQLRMMRTPLPHQHQHLLQLMPIITRPHLQRLALWKAASD